MSQQTRPVGRARVRGKPSQAPAPGEVDLIALGPKARTRDQLGKLSTPTIPKPRTTFTSEETTTSKKRRATEAPEEPPSEPKKARIASLLTETSPTDETLLLTSEAFVPEPAPPTAATDALSGNNRSQGFVASVLATADQGDQRTVARLIGQTLQQLRAAPLEPSKEAYLSLLYVVKLRPALVTIPAVFEPLLSFLRHDTSHSFRRNNLLPVLACNLLMAGFQSKEEWPIEFVYAYFEDALGDRVWVDDELAKPFVDNVLTALPLPPVAAEAGHTPAHPPPAGRPQNGAESMDTDEGRLVVEEEDELEAGDIAGPPSAATASAADARQQPLVRPRYTSAAVREQVRRYVVGTLRPLLQAAGESARSVVKTVAVACGYEQVRAAACERLDEWLGSPATVRQAREVLQQVVQCTRGTSPDDVACVQALLRMKPRPAHAQAVHEAWSVLLGNHPSYPALALRLAIQHEAQSTKQALAGRLLAVVWRAFPARSEHDTAEHELALVVQELATREDARRMLRPLLRRIVRAIDTRFNLLAFCMGLLTERPEMLGQDRPLVEAWLYKLVEMVCVACLLAVPDPAPAGTAPSEAVHRAQLREFQQSLAKVQLAAVCWCHVTLPKYLGGASPHFADLLRKLLFLDVPQALFGGEYSPEAERVLFRVLTTDTPVYEDTITRLVLMPLTSLPLSAADALDILQRVIRRAVDAPPLAADHPHGLVVQNPQLAEAIFQLSLYGHSAPVPSPLFAVAGWFWQAAEVLLVLGSFNPATLGRELWEAYPTMKCLFEMCLTRTWRFPPVPRATTAGDDGLSPEEAAVAGELVQQKREKGQILALETALARQRDPSAAAVDEAHSVLLPQLMAFLPRGPPRCPPPAVLKRLEAVDADLRLGHRLSRSRAPDFLLDIITRQGPQQSMLWLGPLIQAGAETLDVLPLSCLCELLFRHVLDPLLGPALPRIIARLALAIEGDPLASADLIAFYLKKLQSPLPSTQVAAQKCLSLILPTPPEDVTTSLPEWLARLGVVAQREESIRRCIVELLSEAVRYQVGAQELSHILSFLFAHTTPSLQPTLASALGKLLSSRLVVVARLLRLHPALYQRFLWMFVNYLDRASSGTSSTDSSLLELHMPSGEVQQVAEHAIEGAVAFLTIPPPASSENMEVEGSPTPSQQLDKLVNTLFPAGHHGRAVLRRPQGGGERPLVTAAEARRLLEAGHVKVAQALIEYLSQAEWLCMIRDGAVSPVVLSSVLAQQRLSLAVPELLQRWSEADDIPRLVRSLELYGEQGVEVAAVVHAVRRLQPQQDAVVRDHGMADNDDDDDVMQAQSGGRECLPSQVVHDVHQLWGSAPLHMLEGLVVRAAVCGEADTAQRLAEAAPPQVPLLLTPLVGVLVSLAQPRAAHSEPRSRPLQPIPMWARCCLASLAAPTAPPSAPHAAPGPATARWLPTPAYLTCSIDLDWIEIISPDLDSAKTPSPFAALNGPADPVVHHQLSMFLHQADGTALLRAAQTVIQHTRLTSEGLSTLPSTHPLADSFLTALLLHPRAAAGQSRKGAGGHVAAWLQQLETHFPALERAFDEAVEVFAPPTVPKSLDALITQLIRQLAESDTAVCGAAYKQLRSLASFHPAEVVSHMGSLVGLIQGRSLLPLADFVERQYPRQYLHTVGIVELLRGHLAELRRGQSGPGDEALEAIVREWCGLLANITDNAAMLLPPNPMLRALVGVVSKILDFLCFYCVEFVPRSLEVLPSSLRKSSTELQVLFPELKKSHLLPLLLQALEGPMFLQRLGLLGLASSPSLATLQLVGVWETLKRALKDQLPPSILPHRTVLLHAEEPAVLKALGDLDTASLRYPAVLESFASYVARLCVTCGGGPLAPSIREKAYSLMQRFMHHHPGRALAMTASVFMDALSGSVSDEVSQAAVDHFIEFVPLFSGSANVMASLICMLFGVGKEATKTLVVSVTCLLKQ